MQVRIRAEQPADEDRIRELICAAFEPMPFADGDEHELPDRLRAASALELSLVAELAGRIVGHIAFSPANCSDGTPGWYALGPVSVDPAHQRSGIGSELIDAGLKALRQRSATGCILTGDPNYYRRFGFVLAPELAPADEPKEYFMLKLLGGGRPRGEIFFHEAFGSAPSGSA